MTNLGELEDLLRKGEKEKAYGLIKEDRGISAEFLVDEGIIFGTIKEYIISISYFELAEKIAEDDKIKEEARENLAVVYYNRGLSYHELNQHEKAIEDYNKAIELNSNLAEAYYNRGNAYREKNQHEKAIEDYNKAIELNPKDAEAYNNRGLSYHELNQHEKAIEDYNKAIELNPKDARHYANRGITQLQTNEELEKAIEDFKHARDLFEGKDKERMLGLVEWAKARKEMNMKNWDKFRERMNEAKGIFEKINDPLSHSFDAFIKFSYLSEELDNALKISNPVKASEEIEKILKNLPEVEDLIEPERTIFGARVSSFAILSEFIGSLRGIDENTDSRKVKEVLTKLHKESKEVEKMFESVSFETGKTTIVNMQRIISSVKQEIESIEWAASKNQKALEILIEYWSRLSSAIKAMNGISTIETENVILEKEIRGMKSELQVGIAETKETISKGFKKLSEEHKEILEKIYETENILMQKDAINARYRIEIKAPLISSLSPISPKIIVDIPIRKLSEEQIEEKAKEVADKIKNLRGNVKVEFLKAINRIPVIGDRLLKRLKKKTKG